MASSVDSPNPSPTPGPTSGPANGSPKAKPLSKFVRLNRQVALYKPANVPETASSLAPTTVLLCAWMNASSKHVDYYARGYMALYPSAQIILVTISTSEYIFQSEAARRKQVMEAVHAFMATESGDKNMLVHSFSNGGGKRCYNIASAYQSITGKVFAPRAFIYDSAPGMPQFRRDVHAISVPGRKMHWFPWLFFISMTYALVAVTYVSVYWMPLGFWYELVWGPTLGLKDPKVLDRETVMAFVYSKEDVTVDWEDVERYAKSTEENGYQVVTKLVEGAEHVQMFKGKDGEKGYWGFVESVWNLGLGKHSN